jgi:hypothetical protein
VSDEVTINGVRVGPSTDLGALLRQQLLDGSVLAGRYDDSPEPGIWSLFAAANGTALEPRLIEAVLHLLTDPDPRVRAGAVGLAQAYAEKFQASDLLRTLASNPKMFEDVSGVNEDPDLAWGLLRAIAGSSNWTPEVVTRLRSAVIEFPNGSAVLAGLVSHDPDWVIEHAPEVIGDQLSRARIVLFRLKEPNQRQRLVSAVPAESPALRRLLASAISDEVKDPEESKQLIRSLNRTSAGQ